MSGPSGQGGTDAERQAAAHLFNRAWELIDKSGRSEDDDVEMFLSAAASCWHWRQVGTAEQVAVGEWQVAHVASLLGYGHLAMMFARRNLRAAQEAGWDGWRLASAHEGMARACAACGDGAGRLAHFASAEEALERETGPEERQVIADQLASVPAVAPTAPD